MTQYLREQSIFHGQKTQGAQNGDNIAFWNSRVVTFWQRFLGCFSTLTGIDDDVGASSRLPDPPHVEEGSTNQSVQSKLCLTRCRAYQQG